MTPIDFTQASVWLPLFFFVAMGIAMLSAGAMYGALGGDAFYAMSLVCVLALLLGLAARRAATGGA